MHHADADQRHVDQALLAEKRYPRNHPDDVRGPERHGAQQEQTDRKQRATDVKDQEVRNPKADDQREQPGQDSELDRFGIEIER